MTKAFLKSAEIELQWRVHCIHALNMFVIGYNAILFILCKSVDVWEKY